MKIQPQSLFAVALAFVAGFVVACNSGTNASSTPTDYITQADLDALKAQLHIVAAPNKSGAEMALAVLGQVSPITAANAATTLVCATPGTLISSPITSFAWWLNSCMGYSAPFNSDDGSVWYLGNNDELLFDGQNCTGNMYVIGATDLDGTVIERGIVFRYDPTEKSGQTADTTFYVPAGEGLTTVTALSTFSRMSGCQPYDPSNPPIELWRAKPNDPNVTGVENAPRGKLFITQPA